MILMFIPYVKTLGYKKQDQISFILANVIQTWTQKESILKIEYNMKI